MYQYFDCRMCACHLRRCPYPEWVLTKHGRVLCRDTRGSYHGHVKPSCLWRGHDWQTDSFRVYLQVWNNAIHPEAMAFVLGILKTQPWLFVLLSLIFAVLTTWHHAHLTYCTVPNKRARCRGRKRTLRLVRFQWIWLAQLLNTQAWSPENEVEIRWEVVKLQQLKVRGWAHLFKQGHFVSSIRYWYLSICHA